jgi:hypothetical protein
MSDEIVYPLLTEYFAKHRPDITCGEILDIVEEAKNPRGIDEINEFENEVWQKYLSLCNEIGGRRRRRQPRSAPKPQPAHLDG